MKSGSNLRTLIALAPVLVSLSCEKSVDVDTGSVERYPPDTRSQVTISQGAWGNIWFWEGDFMPVGWGNIAPVVRTVYVHELTSLQQVDQVSHGAFYRAIHTNLIDSVQSNSTGFFQIPLDAGQYSFFIKEDSLYYANAFDGFGHILPATIKKDSLTKVQIDITYKATF
jgi:hypothetical protein